MLGCIQGNLFFEVVATWLLLAGAIGFVAMGIDKARAVGGEWRLPEVTLFIIALAGGALGMVIASEVFHHKTSKFSFLIPLYGVVALWLVLLYQVGFLDCLSTYLPH